MRLCLRREKKERGEERKGRGGDEERKEGEREREGEGERAGPYLDPRSAESVTIT